MLPDNYIPCVIWAKTNFEVLAALATLIATPKFVNALAAQEWLLTLRQPSGWFADTAEAIAYLDQFDGGTETKLFDSFWDAKLLKERLRDLAEMLGKNSGSEARRIQKIGTG